MTAAEAFLLLPKEKQTVSRLATVVVRVVLSAAVKCVGFHYAKQWALNAVAKTVTTPAFPSANTFILCIPSKGWRFRCS